MHNLNQEFIIHPVGQGLFYSGKISHKNKVKFRMVFDCGSVTSGAYQSEINIYRDDDFLKYKIIDLLVISHFHQDHVNQIGNLLNGKIKIKKLVMPFLTYEERLFLVLKQFTRDPGQSEDDFFIRFAIDPFGTLNDNLDGNSEVFLIESDPTGPLDRDQISDESRDFNTDNPEKRFEFSFKNKEPITPSENPTTSNTDVKGYKVFDSENGIVCAEEAVLMEFIFYRRKVTENERAYYEEVVRLFYEEFKIDSKLPKDELLNEIIETVKEITSGKDIESIFLKAKRKTKIKGIKLEDSNTTALSLLHRNMPAILKLGRD
ncbi:hypothetical protein OF897_12210 [Chryseobacterium formosus]|uniref:Metallo-beta-lactamase domain-containing protein n=1 Tax=Chryseobacterium formosus TaxID=1537363 RepID=A0ABT3XRB6_9FLAO|nr:hypothetical protein [Chryseobacterium formosus]MCX8524677.1 hypothetical protein [Chryseobacterium formosus]